MSVILLLLHEAKIESKQEYTGFNWLLSEYIQYLINFLYSSYQCMHVYVMKLVIFVK